MPVSSGKNSTKDIVLLDLLNLEKAELYLSYKDEEGCDWAWLFIIKDNNLYDQWENYDTPLPRQFENGNCDTTHDYYENIAATFSSFKEFTKKLVEDFVSAKLQEFEGDTSVLARGGGYKVTVFVGGEKVHEETILYRYKR